MKISLELSFLILIVTTLTGVLISYFIHSGFLVLTVLIFAAIKFLLVGFQFMELKKAHNLWKFLFMFYALLICTLMTLTLI